MRAVGYVRVSTEEQAEEGFSLAAQRRSIAAFCEAKDWQLVHIYADEGISGKDVRNRPALQTMLVAAQNHECDVVVVARLDRLSRTTTQLLALVHSSFTSNDVRLVSVSEGIDPTTPAGQFVMTILAGLAQMEREQIGERTRAGMHEARRQGKHIGKCPFGWRPDKYGTLQEHAQEQATLDWAAHLYVTQGAPEAARLLGWPLSTLKDRLRKREVFKPRCRRKTVTGKGAAQGQPGPA